MIIYLEGLYGFHDNKRAYYKKVGNGCFTFVNDIRFASNLSADECDEIIKYEDWYRHQYKASKMGIIFNSK